MAVNDAGSSRTRLCRSAFILYIMGFVLISGMFLLPIGKGHGMVCLLAYSYSVFHRESRLWQPSYFALLDLKMFDKIGISSVIYVKV